MNPLQTIYQLANEEQDPFRRLHRIKDSGEAIAKLSALVLVNAQIAENGITADWKAELLEKGKAPALGIWSQLADKALKGKPFPIRDAFRGFWNEAKKELQGITELRNKLSHAGGQDPKTVQKFSEGFSKHVISLLEHPFWKNVEFHWIANPSTEGYENLEISIQGNQVSLTPYIWRKEDVLYFFNGYDPDYSPSYISYSKESSVQKRKDLRSVFLSELPLEDWQKSPGMQFLQKLSFWDKGFLGREEILASIREIQKSQNSIYHLIGENGTGKTAIASHSILSGEDRPSEEKILEFFFDEKRRTNTFEFFREHFIDRTEEYVGKRSTPEEDFLKFVQETMDKMKTKGYYFYLHWDGVEDAPSEVWEVLELLLNCTSKVLLTSVPSFKIPDRITNKNRIQRESIPPLSESESMALLESVWENLDVAEVLEETVLQSSSGNPRYLKLWASSLKTGRRGLGRNPREQMPGEIQNYFEGIVDSLRQKCLDLNKDMDLASDILFVLGYGNPMSVSDLSTKLHTGEENVEDHLDLLKDLILPLEDETWKIFHPLFATFLKLKYPSPYLLSIQKAGLDVVNEKKFIKKSLVKF